MPAMPIPHLGYAMPEVAAQPHGARAPHRAMEPRYLGSAHTQRDGTIALGKHIPETVSELAKRSQNISKNSIYAIVAAVVVIVLVLIFAIKAVRVARHRTRQLDHGWFSAPVRQRRGTRTARYRREAPEPIPGPGAAPSRSQAGPFPNYPPDNPWRQPAVRETSGADGAARTSSNMGYTVQRPAPAALRDGLVSASSHAPHGPVREVEGDPQGDKNPPPPYERSPAYQEQDHSSGLH